jgi:hypothetical protein
VTGNLLSPSGEYCPPRDPEGGDIDDTDGGDIGVGPDEGVYAGCNRGCATGGGV